MTRTLSGVLLAGVFAFLIGGTRAADADFQPIFNGKDFTGWKTFYKDGDKADPKAIVVKDGEVQVAGTAVGYFYSDKSFKNFVVRYSWRYPKEQPEKTTMNSGLLLHMQEPHKIWPKCVEPQGRYLDHGKLFFTGFAKDAQKESTFDEAALKKAIKPADEWNTTEVTARGDGSIEVRVNGALVSKGKSELTSGPIGFQAEGARIYFKDIQVKKLD
jgi:hypothetical protein